MRTEHTPGPWYADIRTGIAVILEEKQHFNCLSGVDGVAKIIGSGVPESPDSYKPITEVDAANASLIAAAPELLEACIVALSIIIEDGLENRNNRDVDPDGVLGIGDVLRSAIAKAKGE